MEHVNMEGVIHHLAKALETLESHVPYAKDGEYSGEHETWKFKENLIATLAEANNLQSNFGL